MVFRSALKPFKAMFRRKASMSRVLLLLTSIIGKEYNFFVRGRMLLGFREQRSQAIAKSKILSFGQGKVHSFNCLSSHLEIRFPLFPWSH